MLNPAFGCQISTNLPVYACMYVYVKLNICRHRQIAETPQQRWMVLITVGKKRFAVAAQTCSVTGLSLRAY